MSVWPFGRKEGKREALQITSLQQSSGKCGVNVVLLVHVGM